MLAPFQPFVTDWTFTSTGGPRGLSAVDLAARVAPILGDVNADLDSAIDAARSTAEENDVILVFGSFDLIERTRAKLGVSP